jgi:hypothetical protein
MTPEGWVVNLGAILGALVAAWQAYGAKSEATKAKTLSEPTGNSWGKMVLAKLMSVEEKLDTHIHDHLTDSIVREKREEKLDNEQATRDEATKVDREKP